VNKREHYQRIAAECLRFAQTAVDPTNKALLLDMAHVWVKLAEQTGEAEAMSPGASLREAVP
jgi:hypothetical protein